MQRFYDRLSGIARELVLVPGAGLRTHLASRDFLARLDSGKGTRLLVYPAAVS